MVSQLAQLPKNSRKLGAMGEQTAVNFLEQKGYLVKERNYRVKEGEIDIIAIHNEYIVFVEVKSRRASKFQVNPLLSITKAKRNRLRLLGELYLCSSRIFDKQPRFDVIGITFNNRIERSIEHIENAF